jgi:hypothetical protein
VPQILTVKFGIPGNVIWTERYTADANGDAPASVTIGGQGGLFIIGTGTASTADSDWVTLDYVQDGGAFDGQGDNFNNVIIGLLISDTITVRNVGEVELTNINLTITGDGFYMTADNCPSQLSPGDSCQFTVVSQAGSGPAGAIVTLQDNWSGNAVNPPTFYINIASVIEL